MNEPRHRPRTIGELRRALDQLGNPWTINPRLGDADPVPDPPRGAQRDADIPAEARVAAVAPDAAQRPGMGSQAWPHFSAG